MASAVKALLLLALFAHLSAVEGYWATAHTTAYCPCKLCCGPAAHGVTANGARVAVTPYNLAADQSIKMGAKIYIPPRSGVLDRVRPAERWFVVDDRGGALDTEARKYGVLRLDVRMRHHASAVRYGRQCVPVFILVD